MARQRRGSISDFFSDELFTRLSHTPPVAIPSSYEMGRSKRLRSGSISGRLRSASELEERGVIDRGQKGALKNLLLSGDERLTAALDKFAITGDLTQLKLLLQGGALEGWEDVNLDLLVDDLDLNFLQLQRSVLARGPGERQREGAVSVTGAEDEENYQFELDDIAGYDQELLAAMSAIDRAGSSNSLLKGTSPNSSMLGFGSLDLDGGLGSVKEEPPDLENESATQDDLRMYEAVQDIVKPSSTLEYDHGLEDNLPVFQDPPDLPESLVPVPRQPPRLPKVEPIITTRRGAAARGTRAAAFFSVPRYYEGDDSEEEYDGDDPKHYVGAYSPRARRKRLERFWEKKKHRIWDRKVKYDVRKSFADSRIRVKGRFVKKSEEPFLPPSSQPTAPAASALPPAPAPQHPASDEDPLNAEPDQGPEGPPAHVSGPPTPAAGSRPQAGLEL